MAGKVLQYICLQSLPFMVPNDPKGQLRMFFQESDPPHSYAQIGQWSMHFSVLYSGRTTTKFSMLKV